MLSLFRRLQKLEDDVRSLLYYRDFASVKRDDLHKLQDLLCPQHQWHNKGQASSWQEMECEKCGKVIALSCLHGGSVACPTCVEEFIKRSHPVEVNNG